MRSRTTRCLQRCLERCLDRWTALPVRRMRTTVAAAVVAFGLAVFALVRMDLDPDVEGMSDGPAAETFAAVSETFGWRERAFVLLEADAPRRADDLVAVAEELRRRLLATGLCAAVEFGPPRPDEDASGGGDRPDAAAAAANPLLFPFGLLLLRDAALVERITTPAGMAERLRQQLIRLSLPGLSDDDERVLSDPLGLEQLLATRLQGLRGGYRFAQGSPYFVDPEGRALLVVVRGRHEPGAPQGALAAQRLAAAITTSCDAALAAAGERAQGVTAAATGGCFFAAESARIVRDDLIVSLSASFVLAALFLALGFGFGPGTVLLLCVPTLWGSTLGIGAFAALHELVLGDRISALSFACAAVLIGLGIDFTIHVVTTALQERRHGHSPTGALLRAFRDTRGRLVLAALTSAAAFLAFLTSDAGFLRDMGAMTALGLAACLAAPFVLLPPILLPALARRPAGAASVRGAPFALMRVCAGAATRAGWTVVGTLGVVALGAAAYVVLEPPRLEDDLRNLHATDSAALATQRRMGEVFEGSFEPILVLVEGAPDELPARCAEVTDALRPLVDDGRLVAATSIADVLPPAAEQRATLEVLRRRDPDAVRAALVGLLEDAGFEDPASAPGLVDYVDGFGDAVAVRSPVTPAGLRAVPGLAPLVDRFVRGGSALVVLQPRRELWDAEARRAVVDGVRTALAGKSCVVGWTGLLPTAVESAELVAGNFTRVAGLTLLTVLLVLAVRFRDPRTVALVLVPSAFGVLVVAAVLSALDVGLNLMNLGVLPMVLALGIDDGIHIVEHARSGRRRSVADVLGATGTGVLMTSATTMVTFGSLALSRSRGLASVGLLSFVGIGACLFASVVLLPALLERLPSWAGRRP